MGGSNTSDEQKRRTECIKSGCLAFVYARPSKTFLKMRSMFFFCLYDLDREDRHLHLCMSDLDTDGMRLAFLSRLLNKTGYGCSPLNSTLYFFYKFGPLGLGSGV